MRKSTFDAVQTLTVVEMKIAAGKKAGRVKNATPWPTPDQQLHEAERRRPKTSVSNLPKFGLGPAINE